MILTFKDSTLRSLFLVLSNDVKYFKHGASSPVSLFSLFRSSASLRWVCPHMCSRYELYHTSGLMVILPMCSRCELHTWAPRHPAHVFPCHTYGLLVILPVWSHVIYSFISTIHHITFNGTQWLVHLNAIHYLTANFWKQMSHFPQVRPWI